MRSNIPCHFMPFTGDKLLLVRANKLEMSGRAEKEEMPAIMARQVALRTNTPERSGQGGNGTSAQPSTLDGSDCQINWRAGDQQNHGAGGSGRQSNDGAGGQQNQGAGGGGRQLNNGAGGQQNQGAGGGGRQSNAGAHGQPHQAPGATGQTAILPEDPPSTLFGITADVEEVAANEYSEYHSTCSYGLPETNSAAL